jgi:hypothetical protein
LHEDALLANFESASTHLRSRLSIHDVIGPDVSKAIGAAGVLGLGTKFFT